MDKISVLLVARNEEAVVSGMIEGLMKSYPEDIREIVVVDDASSDNTADKVNQSGLKYPGVVKLLRRKPPFGVGYAIKAGLAAISPKSEYILSMDSDFLEEIPYVRPLLEAARSGSAAVIGSRFCPGGKLIDYPGTKFCANRFYHFLVRWLLRVPMSDVTNNFKLYKREVFLGLPLKSNNFGINAEIGILPALSGIRVREVPVIWAARLQDMGRSKFSILKAGPDYFFSFLWCAWQLLAYRIRRGALKDKI